MNPTERPVEMNCNQPQLLVWHTVQIFPDGFTDTAHGNNDMFRIFGPIVVKQPIGSTQFCVYFGNLILHNLGQRLIKRI